MKKYNKLSIDHRAHFDAFLRLIDTERSIIHA